MNFHLRCTLDTSISLYPAKPSVVGCVLSSVVSPPFGKCSRGFDSSASRQFLLVPPVTVLSVASNIIESRKCFDLPAETVEL